MIAINDLALSNNEMTAVAGGTHDFGFGIGIAQTSLVELQFAAAVNFAAVVGFESGFGLGLSS